MRALFIVPTGAIPPLMSPLHLLATGPARQGGQRSIGGLMFSQPPKMHTPKSFMSSDRQLRPQIAAQTAESFSVIAGAADAGLILLCDHARNAFPPGYGTLGLPEAQLKRHIAYDIGAEAITRHLAASLGVPAVVTHFSRLLIDPNRGEDDPTLIMRLSDGAIVPGNRGLAPAEQERRLQLYYRPYHQAIGEVLDACQVTGITPAILSIHSFTESWKTVPRPWHVGILWDHDPRLAAPLLEALYAEGDLIVGDNQPYHGGLEGDTMWKHGTSRDLAHALIEVRQDLIREQAGQTAWARRLARLMRQLLDRPDLQLAFRKSRTQV
jgi:predicted N-formylglutamate amidohydrolase